MRLDIVLPNEGPSALEVIRSALAFEEMGYHGLWLTDHVVYHREYPSFYGATWLELLASLSHVAALTSRIRLGLGILVVPYRDGVLTAKMLATIDQLSGGRVDLGIGTGWAEPEFASLGRGDVFARRGAVTNETLEVFELCWRETGPLSFAGEFHRFADMEFEPKPVQRPRIPIWIGSSGVPDPAGSVLRRVARFADVWHPTGYEGQILTPAELVAGKTVIDALAGRDIPFSVRLHDVGHWPLSQLLDLLGSYSDAGCIEVAVDLGPMSAGALRDRAEELIVAARNEDICAKGL